MWFMPIDSDWGLELDQPEEGKSKNSCALDTDHAWVEKPLLLTSYWKCAFCECEIDFDEIKEHHTVLSRCSPASLPWERD